MGVQNCDQLLKRMEFRDKMNIKMNYQVMRMEFRDKEGRKVVLRGMNTGPPRIVTTKRMEVALRHRNIAWAAECVITHQK